MSDVKEQMLKDVLIRQMSMLLSVRLADDDGSYSLDEDSYAIWREQATMSVVIGAKMTGIPGEAEMLQ